MLKSKLQSVPKKKFVNLYAALKKKKQNLNSTDDNASLQWVNERLDQSCRSCRYELPMDIKQLEKLTIQEYLLKYCKIARHRKLAYKKVYEKHRNKLTGQVGFEELTYGVYQVLGGTVSQRDLTNLFYVLSIAPRTLVELPIFNAVCALAERILYCSILGKSIRFGEARSLLEATDFDGLKWKLEGVRISKTFKRILMSLG